MGGVFAGMLLVGPLIMCVFFVGFCSGSRCSYGCLDGGRIGQGHRRQRLARINVAILAMSMIVLILSLFMIVRVLVMFMMVVLMMLRIGAVMFGVVRVGVTGFGLHAFCVLLALMRLSGLRRIGTCVLDDFALDAFAVAAAARIAVAWTAAVGAVFRLFLCLAMGAFVRLDQRLAIGDRTLIIARMDFAEAQKAVTVAAVFDEGRLQRRLYARDLGEIDVAAQLLALSGLEIKFFAAIAADHNDPGLFRVGGIDQHVVGHFGALDGGARVIP